MLQNISSDIDYDNDFKVVVATVEDSSHLRSLDSFSRSSESLLMSVSKLDNNHNSNNGNGNSKERRKKARSVSRKSTKDDSIDVDFSVSRDIGESYMSEIMRNANKDKFAGECEEERLRLMNIKLESKLLRMTQENEEVLRERTHLRTEVESVYQDLHSQRSNVETVLVNYETLKREVVLIEEKKTGFENDLRLLKSDLLKKNIDMVQLNNELHNCQDQLGHSESKLQTLSMDLDEKQAVISDLKRKISELHTQLELTKIYQENSEYQGEQLKLELETMKSSRKWFEDQIRNLEQSKELLQNEVNRINGVLSDANRENQLLTCKNRTIEQRFAKFSETKLQETIGLLSELEQLQKEILLSSEEKQNLEEQYIELMQKHEEKIRILESEQEINRNFADNIRDIVMELDDVKQRLKNTIENNDNLELDCRELKKNVAVLDGNLQQKNLEIQQMLMDKQNLEEKFGEHSKLLIEKDSENRLISDELLTLRFSLERVMSERDVAQQNIEQLRNDITKVEEQFDLTRQNLASKESALKLMDDFCDNLKMSMKDNIDKISEKDKLIESLKTEKSRLLDTCEQLQHNHQQILYELDCLRNNLNLANLTIAGLEDELNKTISCNQLLTQDNSRLLEEISKLKSEALLANQQLDEFIQINEKYSQLLHVHRNLQVGFDNLSDQHGLLKKQFAEQTESLKEKLQQRELELEKLVAQRDEILSSNQQTQLFAEQTNVKLSNEIESLKFNYAIELATKDERYKEELDKSRKDLSELCQEKLRCEAAIDNLQSHIKEIVSDYDGKLKECKTKMLTLQRQSSTFAEYESRSRDLLEELERKKGEIEAVLESLKKMKQHAGILETALARREASFLELLNNHQMALREKDEKVGDLSRALEAVHSRLKNEESLTTSLTYQLEERVAVIEKLERRINDYDYRYRQLDGDYRSIVNLCEQLSHDKDKWKSDHDQLSLELDGRLSVNRKVMEQHEELQKEMNLMKQSFCQSQSTAKSLKQDLKLTNDKWGRSERNSTSALRNQEKELANMHKFVEDMKQSRDTLVRKMELSSQQELIASAILARLRSEVKKIIFKNQIKDTSKNPISIDANDIAALQKLIIETEEPAVTSKPLGRLSKCIEELRTQIDTMQNEMTKQLDDTLFELIDT